MYGKGHGGQGLGPELTGSHESTELGYKSRLWCAVESQRSVGVNSNPRVLMQSVREASNINRKHRRVTVTWRRRVTSGTRE